MIIAEKPRRTSETVRYYPFNDVFTFEPSWSPNKFISIIINMRMKHYYQYIIFAVINGEMAVAADRDREYGMEQ